MPHVVRVEELQELGRLVDLLELLWLRELAELDRQGAAGAEQGTRAPSTARWLQARLGMSAAEASSYVQTARALFGGPARQRQLEPGDIANRSPTDPPTRSHPRSP